MNPLISQTEPFEDALAVSDIVIAGNSTTVLEAMLAGKPVILYGKKPEDPHFQDYIDAGAVLLATTPEELVQCVAKLLPKQMVVKTSDGVIVIKPNNR